MNTPETRRATVNDVGAIAALEAEIFSDAWGEDALLSYIDTSFVATVDGEIVGYLISNLIAPEGELYRIAINEKHRRLGVGKALLSYSISSLAKRGLTTFYLEVREKNTPARALYTALGFRECGLRRNYYKNPSDNGVLMVYDYENSCI